MRALLILLFLFALPAQAMMAGAPDEFLRGLYDYYLGPYSRGIPLNNAKQMNKVFTPDLVRLIQADRKQAKGEVGRLDGDPFVDAQDWKIEHMRIGIENETPASATATAHFDNNGRDTIVTLLLVKQKAGWRVNEIIMPSGSLRQLLTSPRL
jgi:hypothetical protein